MQAVNTELDCRTLTDFDNLVVDVFSHLGNHFFNARRVNTSVGHQLVERQTGNLATHRIKARQYDGFRGVVDDNFNAGSGFERADVASFATDDTSFDFVVFDVEYRNAVFNGVFHCSPLNRLDNDFLRFLIRLEFRLVRDAALDLVALGLDPEQAALFVQSDVPEVTELTWLLMTVTPMGLLERCHAYKDKKSRGIAADAGLFTYPVLMSADILAYDATVVPGGEEGCWDFDYAPAWLGAFGAGAEGMLVAHEHLQ